MDTDMFEQGQKVLEVTVRTGQKTPISTAGGQPRHSSEWTVRLRVRSDTEREMLILGCGWSAPSNTVDLKCGLEPHTVFAKPKSSKHELSEQFHSTFCPSSNMSVSIALVKLHVSVLLSQEGFSVQLVYSVAFQYFGSCLF